MVLIILLEIKKGEFSMPKQKSLASKTSDDKICSNDKQNGVPYF